MINQTKISKVIGDLPTNQSLDFKKPIKTNIKVNLPEPLQLSKRFIQLMDKLRLENVPQFNNQDQSIDSHKHITEMIKQKPKLSANKRQNNKATQTEHFIPLSKISNIKQSQCTKQDCHIMEQSPMKSIGIVVVVDQSYDRQNLRTQFYRLYNQNRIIGLIATEQKLRTIGLRHDRGEPFDQMVMARWDSLSIRIVFYDQHWIDHFESSLKSIPLFQLNSMDQWINLCSNILQNQSTRRLTLVDDVRQLSAHKFNHFQNEFFNIIEIFGFTEDLDQLLNYS